MRQPTPELKLCFALPDCRLSFFIASIIFCGTSVCTLWRESYRKLPVFLPELKFILPPKLHQAFLLTTEWGWLLAKLQKLGKMLQCIMMLPWAEQQFLMQMAKLLPKDTPQSARMSLSVPELRCWAQLILAIMSKSVQMPWLSLMLRQIQPWLACRHILPNLRTKSGQVSEHMESALT